MPRKKDPWWKCWSKDVLSDDNLKLVSLAAIGLCYLYLNLMHRSGRKGYLLKENGKPYSLDEIAKVLGRPTDEVSRLQQELVASGVFSESESGLIFSRRMVREADISEKRREAGLKGAAATNSRNPGEPTTAKTLDSVLPRQNVRQTGRQTGRQTSGSGICISNSNSEIHPGEDGGVGEGEVLPRQNVRQTPGEPTTAKTLAAAWAFYRKGRGREDIKEVGETFEEMIAMGVKSSVIDAEIMLGAPQRDRSEYLWEFKKRLMDRHKATAEADLPKDPHQEKYHRMAAERRAKGKA